ncbi:L,D-transpeptidase [Hufsiella ginkgonis]|uniref:L,D-transpeptidase family protein n=1 Tax=Hufsiella ginkgonis TaxID=2695274 RepID=A0A7K1Y095_9SPHI|nr:L,D-transpeptidase family protein [Hufsiella ginkgonis]MXV16643.1 L,D-transpeptidase family protein [Hufsiella ginkgonis]
MNKSKKYSTSVRAIGLALCIVLGLLAGCDNQNRTQNGSADKQADTVKQKASTDNIRNIGLTLPVLDALFFEDGFKADLKSRLQLTDQQILQLKTAASASVADLSEDGIDYLGSAREATRRSDEQIRTILGQEKADQLYQLVAERYAGGDVEGLFPTQPNAVPSDTRVVVNAPAFRMDVFQNGKLLKTYRVGIGYPEFPLPTGMRRAENIIFNPTWTPPDEPWVKGKVQAGKKVAAGSELNPLGPIKIPIGMPSLIHGGKEVSKLGNFASHGCVGLTDGQVQDFTGMLTQLAGKPMSMDSILGFEKSKRKTQSVKLEKPVLIELRYETIVAGGGSLHIYRDVYERGTNTLENATQVLKVYGVGYQSLSPQEKEALTNALNEMNLDSQGNPIVGNIEAAGDTTIKTKDGVAPGKVERAKKGKVTRAVAGRKEIAVPVAGLQGKGYPGPVNLDEGK